jgi:hypothetical protein
MGLMDMLSGGKRREEYEDFVGRYEQGEPWEGIEDDEARNRHDEVASNVSDDDYELSAREAYERLSPQQRKEFAGMLRQQGRQGNVDLGDYDRDDDDRDADPQHLARMTRQVRKQKPDLMGQLLGGGGGGGGGGMGGMLGNPVAKAALGGIAAMAAKRMLRR